MTKLEDDLRNPWIKFRLWWTLDKLRGVLALIAVTYAVWTLLTFEKVESPSEKAERALQSIDSLKNEIQPIRDLANESAAILGQMGNLESRKLSATEVVMLDLRNQQKKTLAHLNALSKSIMDSPEKAVTLPVLRAQLASLNTRLDDTRLEVARQMDGFEQRSQFHLTMMTGMGAFIVALLGLSLFQNRKNSSADTDQGD